MEQHPRIAARRAGLDRAYRRELILLAAENLISSRGVDQLSARQLAAAVGISPSDLYDQFTGLDELQLNVALRCVTTLESRLQSICASTEQAERLTALTMEYVSFATSRKQLWRTVVSPACAGDLPEWYTSKLKLLSAPFEAALQSRQSGLALWAGVHGIVTLGVRGGGPDDITELALCLVRAFVAGRQARDVCDGPTRFGAAKRDH